MRSLPAPLRDLILGAVLVSLVLVVLEAVGSGDVGVRTWALVPLGAGLFAVRRGVRRAVLTQAAATPGPEGRPAPAPSESRRDDPVRVLALGALAVTALVAVAWWW